MSLDRRQALSISRVHCHSTAPTEESLPDAATNGDQFVSQDNVPPRSRPAGLCENQVTFSGANGVGLEFSLAQPAIISVLSNTVVDEVSGGTGVLFSQVVGGSTIQLEGNLIDLREPTGEITDYGIVFESMTGSTTLTGNGTNRVKNATTPFFVPAGRTTGSVRINGDREP